MAPLCDSVGSDGIMPYSTGSERQKSTGATGKTLKEGSNINKSLLSLGAVISKLGEASKKVMFLIKLSTVNHPDMKLHAAG